MFFPGLGWMGTCAGERQGNIPPGRAAVSQQTKQEVVGNVGTHLDFWLCPPSIMRSSPLGTSSVLRYLWAREGWRHLCLPESCFNTSSFIIRNPSPPLARKFGRITLYTSSILRGS